MGFIAQIWRKFMRTMEEARQRTRGDDEEARKIVLRNLARMGWDHGMNQMIRFCDGLLYLITYGLRQMCI